MFSGQDKEMVVVEVYGEQREGRERVLRYATTHRAHIIHSREPSLAGDGPYY
jgi:hypothetical protein